MGTKLEYQCPTCIHGHNGKGCWSEYPNATKCQDYKKDRWIKNEEKTGAHNENR